MAQEHAAKEAEDYIKVLLTIACVAITCHYILQLSVLAIGGKPNFEDTGSLAVNATIISVFLLIGWFLRRVWLVNIIFLALGLSFILPFLFKLQGTASSWGIQFLTYVLPPILSACLFTFVAKVFDLPDSPLGKKRNKESKSL